MRRLEPLDGAFGQRPVTTIDRPRTKPAAGQLPLQSAYLRGPDTRIPRARKQDPRRRPQRRQRDRTRDPVDAQAMSVLEQLDGALGPRPE